MRDLQKISRGEVYRYMGFRDEMPEAHVREMTEKIICEVGEAAAPKFCAIDTKVCIEGDRISFDSFAVHSKSLAKHLTECDEAVIFAATLGSSVDMLIYKYSLMSPAKAVAAQAAATAMIEMYADDICDLFKDNEKERGLFITPRFSPGYGDLPLRCQENFLTALSAGKRIGLCLTDSDMLTPVKSITAVVGKTKKENMCVTKKCSICPNKGCSYRK